MPGRFGAARSEVFLGMHKDLSGDSGALLKGLDLGFRDLGFRFRLRVREKGSGFRV